MSTAGPRRVPVAGFRVRLLSTMMVVVIVFLGVTLYVAERRIVTEVVADLERSFQAEIGLWQKVREIRQAALVERVRVLVRKSRLASTLEPADDALDLLYDTADFEMRVVMETPPERAGPAERGLHAEFYRFLDRDGKLIPIPAKDQERFGILAPQEEYLLELPRLTRSQQIGYLVHRPAGGEESLVELIAMPIISVDSDQVIAALVVGFETLPLAAQSETGIRQALWRDGRLYSPAIPAATRAALAPAVTRALEGGQPGDSSFVTDVDGVSLRVFHQRLNPDSLYAPASEVAVFPLTALEERRRSLRWQIAGAGLILLLGAFVASHYLSGRLARVVTDLAEASAEDRAQRHRAEAELELRQEELARAARFSADASHQLKTPVAVLRAGLEELAHREGTSPRTAEEISALVHQTYRLSGIIEDLLLLSRIDAGRLAIVMAPVNLSELFAAALDDVGAVPDAETIAIENELPAGLNVLGERRYLALVVQNLMENAAKYNRPGGRIRVAASESGDMVAVTVENTGRPIPPEVQARIFERFHRGAVGENVPGYGLGLNLARELARLHGGDLRLVGSNETGTRFELQLRRAIEPKAAA
jgi:signal transduction histidine kinase